MINTCTMTTSGSVITEAERATQTAYIREAVRQGHKFIKIKLTDEFKGSLNQSEIKFNGVKTVMVYGAGRGKGNVPKFEVVVRGGTLVFYFKQIDNDPMKDGWYADLLDDKTPAKYAEVGYNRDFLASHKECGWFKVLDPKVKHDINNRCKRIAEITKENEEKKINDSKAYIETLKQKQAMIKEEIDAAEDRAKAEGGGEEKDANNETGGGVD